MVVKRLSSQQGTSHSRGIRAFIYLLKSPSDLLSCAFNAGDPIVISIGRQIALAVGFILQLTREDVTVTLDRPLRGLPRPQLSFHGENQQNFFSTLELSQATHQSSEPSPLYRMDLDEMASGFSTLRSNLIQLMNSTREQDERLRRWMVDRSPPRFHPHPPKNFPQFTSDALGNPEKPSCDLSSSSLPLISSTSASPILTSTKVPPASSPPTVVEIKTLANTQQLSAVKRIICGLWPAMTFHAIFLNSTRLLFAFGNAWHWKNLHNCSFGSNFSCHEQKCFDNVIHPQRRRQHSHQAQGIECSVHSVGKCGQGI